MGSPVKEPTTMLSSPCSTPTRFSGTVQRLQRVPKHCIRASEMVEKGKQFPHDFTQSLLRQMGHFGQAPAPARPPAGPHPQDAAMWGSLAGGPYGVPNIVMALPSRLSKNPGALNGHSGIARRSSLGLTWHGQAGTQARGHAHAGLLSTQWSFCACMCSCMPSLC